MKQTKYIMLNCTNNDLKLSLYRKSTNKNHKNKKFGRIIEYYLRALRICFIHNVKQKYIHIPE